ncbi:MAG: hypothetical protein ACMXYC_00920 [Candidatus Woesearchaeota archaeon]
MFKKAQGMSINTIIITILALLVLVVIASVLIGRMGLFVGTTKNCVELGGICEARVGTFGQQGCENAPVGFQRYDPSMSCIDDTTGRAAANQVCCVPG